MNMDIDLEKRGIYKTLINFAKEKGFNTPFKWLLSESRYEDNGEIAFSSRAHLLLLQDLEKEGRMKILNKVDSKTVTVKVFKPRARESFYTGKIKTLKSLVRNKPICEEVLALIRQVCDLRNDEDLGEVEKRSVFIDERYDDLALLMEQLGILKPDWDYLDKQTSSIPGCGLIKAELKPAMIKKLGLIFKAERASSSKSLPKRSPKVKEIFFMKDPCKLSCSRTQEEYTFRNDNRRKTILIRAAFQYADKLGDWIDGFAPGMDESFKGRDIYDTARQINQVFRTTFDLSEQLFLLDYANKRARVNTSSRFFKILQK